MRANKSFERTRIERTSHAKLVVGEGSCAPLNSGVRLLLNLMEKKSFPRWLGISWLVVYPLMAILVGRLLYERTYLTWKYGEQAIGFVFVHAYGLLFLASALGFFLAHGWLLAALVFILLRPGRVSRADWVKVGLVVLTSILFFLPVEKLLGIS